MTKKIFLILLILLMPAGIVFGAQDDGVYTYVFHLYFDNGKLFADRDFKVPFELIAQKYEAPKQTATTYYFGEVVSVSNKKLADFQIVDLPYGGKGKISPHAPYFDNAKTVNFYNSQNIKILSLDLAPSGPVCNEDKICNNDTGETYLNCPADCSVPTSSLTPSPSASLPSYNPYAVFASPFFIGLVVALMAILIWLFLRKKKNNSPPPPEISSPQI